jgi:hypothetical protein
MINKDRKPLTPPINTRGIYTCFAPFELPTDIVYTAEAIRTFPELERRDREIFEEVYEPKELALSIYEDDANLGASIVTLRAADGELRFIPNTFIESYPGMAGLNYSRNVLIADLGKLPATVDVEMIAGDVKDLLIRHIGVSVVMTVDTMEHEGDITHTEHVELEIARKAKIRAYVPLEIQLSESVTRNDALTTSNLELVELVQNQQLQIEAYEAMLPQPPVDPDAPIVDPDLPPVDPDIPLVP